MGSAMMDRSKSNRYQVFLYLIINYNSDPTHY